MAERKIVLIGRHGEAPQWEDDPTLNPEGKVGSKDELKPESVTKVYNAGVELSYIAEEFSEEQTQLTHTDKVRTLLTGEALIAGALNMQPSKGTNPPTCQEDLANYDGLAKITSIEEPKLGYVFNKVSDKCYKELGQKGMINFMLANPNATDYNGEDMMTPNELRRNVCLALKDSLYNMFTENKDFGSIISHAVLADNILLNLIDSKRETPVDKIDDIGIFNMTQSAKDLATLTIDQNNGVWQAKVEFKGVEYAVDPGNILCYK